MWVRLRSQVVERHLEQRQLAPRFAERRRGLAGAEEQGHTVGAGERIGIRNAIPQLQRMLEQHHRLLVGVHALGRRRCAHGGPQRGRGVARRSEMVGDSGDDLRVGSLLDSKLQHPRECQMQIAALPGEQVVHDDLPQQGMAEPVHPVGLCHQEIPVDGLAQRVAQGPPVEPARVLEQWMVESLGDRDEPQQLLRRLGQPFDPQHQRVAQGVRRCAVTVAIGGQQLLPEERVAARAGP
jgi:hypothetical protein